MNARTFTMMILAALMLVLTLASSAWAECAWVLWQEISSGGDFSYGASMAVTSESQCRRVAAKSRSRIPTMLSIRHCDLHRAANEMLYLLMGIYFSGERWRAKIEALERERLGRAWDDVRRDFKHSFGEKSRQALAYYVDPETAILEGRRNVNRTKTTCRLCEATLEDDDLARLLHLRSSHRKEWRALVK
jgi:hypothetical protein